MSNELVSIIIPVYNRSKIIAHTLDSILVQTYINWECIIVDDGSTDDSWQTLSKYQEKNTRFKAFKRPNNIEKGANACRNYGFKQAKGIYINWFDSDDIMKPEFLQTKVSSFSENIDAVLHRNRYSNYELTRFRDSKYTYDEHENLLYHYLNEDIEIQTSGFMWKKSFLENKPLFNETIQRYQDNEFHVRMLIENPKVIILTQELATIRGGDGDNTQISSSSNLTKKKLLDIFYFRCQSVKAISTLNLEEIKEKQLSKKLLKKAIWAFYKVLCFEKSIVKRTQDFKNNYKALNNLYINKYFTFIDKIKSQTYIIFIILFKKTNYKS